MPNTVQAVTVPSSIATLDGTKEVYVCPSTDVLEAGDLVPNTEAMTYPSRSRNVSDVALDGGGSLKIPDPGQTIQDVTMNVYTGQNNVKWQEIETSYENKTLQKYNIFAQDGSGWKGVAYISALGAADDSGFHYTMTLALQNVERIARP